MNRRVYSEGNQVKRSPFPHRGHHQTVPIIATKQVPLHHFKMNKSYLGPQAEAKQFQRWAFIPFQDFRHPLLKRDTKVKQQTQQQSSYSQPHLNSSSFITLEKYLKRKKLKQRKQHKYFSQMVTTCPLEYMRNNKQQLSIKTKDASRTFLTSTEFNHLQRLKNFLNPKQIKTQNCQHPVMAQTEPMKVKPIEDQMTDSIPVTYHHSQSSKLKAFKIKSQQRKLKNSLSSWVYEDQ